MEQENGLTKAEVIGNLYGLRAGLSVISQEKDKADGLKKEAMDECFRIGQEFAKQSDTTFSRSDFEKYFSNSCERDKKETADDILLDFLETGDESLLTPQLQAYLETGDESLLTPQTQLQNQENRDKLETVEELATQKLLENVSCRERKHRGELNNRKNSLEYHLKETQEELKVAQKSVDKIVQECRGQYMERKSKGTMYKVFAILLVPIVAFLLWIFIGSFFEGTIAYNIALKIDGEESYNDLVHVGALILLGFPIGAVAGMIGFGICAYRAHDYLPYCKIDAYRKQDIKKEEDLRDTIQQKFKNTENDIQKTIREIQECERKAQWGQQNAAQYAKRIAETVQSCHLAIMEIKQKCDGVYTVLRDRFAKELDERDWQHIDLIIFYYETGRAFTKQEALQLTDREVQTDRIVKSIGMAAQYICGSIQSGFSQISRQLSTISDSLIRISAHVGNISDELVKLNDVQRDHLNELEKQSAQMNEYTEQLHELVKAENLSNALQEKANESSKQLMEDVQFFRDYIS